MFKIFIVEDELTIRTELKTLLEKYGYECITTDDFTSVLSAIEAASPHLILLDINLPHFDGYHICREIRSHSQIPIIIVTSRNSDVDELMSMNLGADDFITKPYHTQILLARIAALLKRSYQTDHESQLEHNGVMLSLSDSTITANGQTAELTKNELKILKGGNKNEVKKINSIGYGSRNDYVFSSMRQQQFNQHRSTSSNNRHSNRCSSFYNSRSSS